MTRLWGLVQDRSALNEYLKTQVYQGTQYKHRGSKCMAAKGITIVVVLVDKIPSSGALASNSYPHFPILGYLHVTDWGCECRELAAWTRSVRARYNLEPECHKDIVIAFSQQDKKLQVPPPAALAASLLGRSLGGGVGVEVHGDHGRRVRSPLPKASRPCPAKQNQGRPPEPRW